MLEKIKNIIDLVKSFSKNGQIYDDVSYTAFYLSLLPIPGHQQCLQIIDRIASDKSLKTQLDSIWDTINTINTSLESIDDEIEKFNVISSTVKYNSQLNELVENSVKNIVSQLNSDNISTSKWIMNTSDWSFQKVIDSIVESDFVEIKAVNNSSNLISNTRITSNETHLHASNNSQNIIDKTEFSNLKGSIGMDDLSTKGDLFVNGDSLGFGNNGSVGFGIGGSMTFGPPNNIVSGNCPVCGSLISLDKRELFGKSHIKCPNLNCGVFLNL